MPNPDPSFAMAQNLLHGVNPLRACPEAPPECILSYILSSSEGDIEGCNERVTKVSFAVLRRCVLVQAVG